MQTRRELLACLLGLLAVRPTGAHGQTASQAGMRRFPVPLVDESGAVVSRYTASAKYILEDFKSIPKFSDFSARVLSSGQVSPPQFVTLLQRRYAERITGAMYRGEGERARPNFAGAYLVVTWSCGAPCTRMAIIDARDGAIYCPPILMGGVGVETYDLPLFRPPGYAYPQNPEVDLRLSSNLMIIDATPRAATDTLSYRYYFLWTDKHWTLLRKAQIKRGHP